MRRAGHPPGRRARLGDLSRCRRRLDLRAATTRCSTRAAREDLEALVLVHQDAEIVDSGLLREGPRGRSRTPRSASSAASARSACAASPGGRARSRCASFINRYDEHGGGDLPSFSWAWDEAPPYARTGEVDTLDGFVLVLSPWVVRNVRFDESLGQLPRLRLRLLPAGPRRRAQGRDRGLPRHPPPPAGARQRPRGVDRRPHQGGREVGRPDAGIGAGAGHLAGAGAARRGRRPKRRCVVGEHRTRSSPTRACASSSARWPRPRASISWRLTAPLRGCGCAPAQPRPEPPRAGAERRPALAVIAFGSSITARRPIAATPSRASASRPSRTRRCSPSPPWSRSRAPTT